MEFKSSSIFSSVGIPNHRQNLICFCCPNAYTVFIKKIHAYFFEYFYRHANEKSEVATQPPRAHKTHLSFLDIISTRNTVSKCFCANSWPRSNFSTQARWLQNLKTLYLYTNVIPNLPSRSAAGCRRRTCLLMTMTPTDCCF